MRLFAAIMLVVSTLATVARAQGPLPVCKVGLHLERAGALNYPATIVDYDAAKVAYQVKFDSGGSVEWLIPRSIGRGCTAPVAGPAITESYFVGNWSMFVGPYPQRKIISGDAYLVVGSGAAAPPLSIKPDGTYVWHIDSKTVINGQWRKMAESEMKYGFKDKFGLMLMKGEGNANWQVTYSGVRSSDKADQLNVERIDLGLSFLATRMK